jgi:hypothetical protein
MPSDAEAPAEFRPSGEIEDGDTAIDVVVLVSRHGRWVVYIERDVHTRLVALAMPTLFLLAPADLLDNERM